MASSLFLSSVCLLVMVMVAESSSSVIPPAFYYPQPQYIVLHPGNLHLEHQPTQPEYLERDDDDFDVDEDDWDHHHRNKRQILPPSRISLPTIPPLNFNLGVPSPTKFNFNPGSSYNPDTRTHKYTGTATGSHSFSDKHSIFANLGADVSNTRGSSNFDTDVNGGLKYEFSPNRQTTFGLGGNFGGGGGIGSDSQPVHFSVKYKFDRKKRSSNL
ncbi:hypothetical protein Pcinc_023485 [Petrolisthes cinctipes]|uniref:Uncharacterized protein n=1 Tax=Petrolisthes cinctipes TaxID=88211 RepID=A0AAE1FFA0_PETCI|nr:hypothetical protein Pcinc_023485 [Petrolisthes cinctipes]